MEKRKARVARLAVHTAASKKEYKKMQKKEKKLANGNGAIGVKVLITIVLIVMAILLVFVSGAFNVKNIKVTGNEKLTQEQVISFSGIEIGKNIFSISKKDIKENLKENSYINHAKIKRVFPNEFELEIEERKVSYLVPLASSYVYLDKQGNVLEISNEKLDVPLVVGFETDLSNIKENDRLIDSDLEKLKIVIKIMETAQNNEMDNLITKIDVSNVQDYVIHMEPEKKIAYLGNGIDLNTRFLYIKAIMQKQKDKTGEIFVDMDLNSEYAYFRENVE